MFSEMLLCYTNGMVNAQERWKGWAERLERWGLKDLAVTFLEAAGPFRNIAAQLVYMGSPLFSSADDQGWQAFASTLEDRHSSRLFADYLKSESDDGNH